MVVDTPNADTYDPPGSRQQSEFPPDEVESSSKVFGQGSCGRLPQIARVTVSARQRGRPVTSPIPAESSDRDVTP